LHFIVSIHCGEIIPSSISVGCVTFNGNIALVGIYYK